MECSIKDVKVKLSKDPLPKKNCFVAKATSFPSAPPSANIEKHPFLRAWKKNNKRKAE
jgi:hypothetical protein